MHLLEPAPQTQTATAHLHTNWIVYFDGQGTQILPCGEIPPPPGGGGGGGIGFLMVYEKDRPKTGYLVKEVHKKQ